MYTVRGSGFQGFRGLEGSRRRSKGLQGFTWV